MEPMLVEKKVTVHCTLEQATVLGDKGLLREMAMNLIDNAVKYNLPGGHVYVSVRKRGDHIDFAVKDTGIGIPEDKQKRVFERFYRADTSRSRKISGSGLGLSTSGDIKNTITARLRSAARKITGLKSSFICRQAIHKEKYMKQYTFPYGRGVQTVVLPEDHVAYELKGTGAAPVADVTKAVQKALRRVYPKDALSERVAPYEKVVIVVSDGTRMVYTPQMLDAVIGEIHTIGVADEQITLLVALGTHRPATKRELTEICGSWANRLRVVQHDCRDKTQLAYVGTTPEGNAVYLNRLAVEADKVILTGGISFHDMAGFSGGRKAVLPGLAGYDTIMRNHALALNAEDIGGRNRCCDAARLKGQSAHGRQEGTRFIEPHLWSIRCWVLTAQSSTSWQAIG